MIIDYDEWFEQYKPIANLNPYSSFYDGEGSNIIFDAHGDDFKQVRKVFNDPDTTDLVWTCVTEGETSFIIPGLHMVNRDSYYITEVPHDNKNIEVNDNEVITLEETIGIASTILKHFKLRFKEEDLRSFYLKNINVNYKKDMYIVPQAKSLLFDFMDGLINELSDEQLEFINDRYDFL